MRRTRLALALLALAPMGTLLAADPAATAMRVKLERLYPATVFTDVSKTPLPGIYEVTMGTNVAYVGEDGRHFLFGHLFDMREQRDLTALKLVGSETAPEPVAKITFKDLPLDDSIKTVKGDGSRVFAVFTDPRCPYCQRLDEELAGLDNVTVYRFLMPVLGPESRTAAADLWAKDMPDRAKDLGVFDRNRKLAERFHINGTPTLVATDGRVHSGVMGAQELIAWLTVGQGRVSLQATPSKENP